MYELTEGEALVLCSSDSQIAKEVREHISFEGVEVEGCVIGPSGAGKSALINSLCGLTGAARALEGAMETTNSSKVFTAAKGGYRIVDIPGVGTHDVPPETYAAEFGLIQYDFLIVMLLSKRLKYASELNAWAIRLAKHDLKKPIFLVYSRFDEFVNEWYDQEVQYDEDAPFLTDLSEKEQRKYIDEAKETLQAEFPRGTFFVGRSLIPKSQADKAHGFDFAELAKSIADSLHARKRDVVVQNFTVYSHEWIDMKKKSLKATMIGMSISAAATGIIPIPGVGAGIEVAILLSFAKRCIKVFCLEKSDLRSNFSPQLVKLFIPQVVALAGASLAVGISFTIDEAIKLLPVVGSVVGSVVGAVISGPIMYVALMRVRDQFADLLLQLMHAQATAQANTHFKV